MSRKVADMLWEMLANAGVKRCYGIVGDALNPVIDALRRNGKIEFIHVRHEEYGVFAAVAEAYLTGNPVAVCGTAGPGVVHLFNGLMDARKEGAPVIAIAGDVETKLIDTGALEELNPYKFFEAASLYTGRLVNPEQARAIINTAILTAVTEKGPTVISIPGDVASADAAEQSSKISIPTAPIFRPSDADLNQLATMIDAAKTVSIFGGDGCRDARDEVIELAARYIPRAQKRSLGALTHMVINRLEERAIPPSHGNRPPSAEEITWTRDSFSWKLFACVTLYSVLGLFARERIWYR